MKNSRKSSPDQPKDQDPQRPAPPQREVRSAPEAPEIDFTNLDLRVEVVEERISPGETNVFDK